MREKHTAIVLAAGKGTRMQSQTAKQYLLIKEKPVLYYSLKAFEDCPFIDEVILVTAEKEKEYCRREIVEKYGFLKVKQLISGGSERYESVYHGLLAVKDCAYVYIHDGARPFVTQEMLERLRADVKEYRACVAGMSVYHGLLAVKDCAYVYIHDGARPFVTQEMLERLRADVKEYRACVAGMPVKDTIKISDENGFIADTPNRALVWQIQTPQVFSYELICSAYQKLFADLIEGKTVHVTDDAMVVEYASDTRVKLTEGSYSNFKITTPEDLILADALV